MEALIRDADAVSTAAGSSQVRSGLEAWFTLPDRPAPMHPPPKWKMALVTWVALRPMVVGLSYALAPLGCRSSSMPPYRRQFLSSC